MEGLSTTATAAAQDSVPRKSIQKLSESFCAPQYAASLKCLDDADYDKSKCQDHFEAYKACRKQELVAAAVNGLALQPLTEKLGHSLDFLVYSETLLINCLVNAFVVGDEKAFESQFTGRG